MTKRQKIRKTVLLVSFMLFPVTFFYFSPYLIIQGSFEGVVSGSFLTFAGLFFSSLFLGRGFCGWVCPAGGMQEICGEINGKKTGKKQTIIKYVIFVPWLTVIVLGFVSAHGIKKVDPLYYTDHGISLSSIYTYLMYFMVLALILILALVVGKRSFCHCVCWMAPFMILGDRIKQKLRYPSLHLEGKKENCIQCSICDKNCPMSLTVSQMVEQQRMTHSECILCGKCVDTCPKKVISYQVRYIDGKSTK